MANVKISGLTSAAAASGTQELEVNDSGTSKKITGSQLLTYVQNNISVGTTAIANDAVTYAKIQNVSAADKLLGRATAGAGDVEEITCTSFARTLLDDADQAAALATLGAPLNGVTSKSAAYTVLAADRGKLIDCTSGTWSLAFTAAATLGDGFTFGVRNSGAGVITLDPNASELIDGASTVSLAAGESCIVVCTGSAWKTVGKTVTPTTGVLLGIYSRFTSGSGLTATRPAGATKARILVQGGGGAGAGYGGGGAGSYAEAIKDVIGDLTVTVGAAASASSVSGSGWSTITAAGGANGGSGGAAPTTGDINLSGQSGQGGAGGSGGGNVLAIGGAGGNPGSAATAGAAGLYGGGGGAGGYDASNSMYGSHGSGSTGFVVIHWYK